MSTCDNLQVPKPATGKTPVRNVRIPDEVWFKVVARAESEGANASEAMLALATSYGDEQTQTGPREFALANWPASAQWVQDHHAALLALNGALCAALGNVPFEWLAVAAWLASTHHEGDADQQKRVLTGHILRRFDDSSVSSSFRDTRHLSQTVQSVLAEHLPLAAS